MRECSSVEEAQAIPGVIHIESGKRILAYEAGDELPGHCCNERHGVSAAMAAAVVTVARVPGGKHWWVIAAVLLLLALASTLALAQGPVINRPTQQVNASQLTPVTGTGPVVLSTSPTLTTPVLGAASATSISFSSTSGIIGTTTNDSAAALSVGQYAESVVAAVSFGATTAWGDCTSLSLTAGDWDVIGMVGIKANGGTVTEWDMGISTTTGNDATGLVFGSNWAAGLPPTAASDMSLSIPAYRVSIASTTTHYLKIKATFTVATPTCSGRLSARRVR